MSDGPRVPRYRVIFLDVDGVLRPATDNRMNIDDKLVKRLVRGATTSAVASPAKCALPMFGKGQRFAEASSRRPSIDTVPAAFVISSSWRTHEERTKQLIQQLARICPQIPVIDVTPSLVTSVHHPKGVAPHMIPDIRAKEILWWLAAARGVVSVRADSSEHAAAVVAAADARPPAGPAVSVSDQRTFGNKAPTTPCTQPAPEPQRRSESSSDEIPPVQGAVQPQDAKYTMLAHRFRTEQQRIEVVSWAVVDDINFSDIPALRGRCVRPATYVGFSEGHVAPLRKVLAQPWEQGPRSAALTTTQPARGKVGARAQFHDTQDEDPQHAIEHQMKQFRLEDFPPWPVGRRFVPRLYL